MRLGAKKPPEKQSPFSVSSVLLKYKRTHAIARNDHNLEKKKKFSWSCHFTMTLFSCK